MDEEGEELAAIRGCTRDALDEVPHTVVV